MDLRSSIGKFDKACYAIFAPARIKTESGFPAWKILSLVAILFGQFSRNALTKYRKQEGNSENIQQLEAKRNEKSSETEFFWWTYNVRHYNSQNNTCLLPMLTFGHQLTVAHGNRLGGNLTSMSNTSHCYNTLWNRCKSKARFVYAIAAWADVSDAKS